VHVRLNRRSTAAIMRSRTISPEIPAFATADQAMISRSQAQFPHERTSARSEGVTGDASAAARSSSARAFVAALSAMRCLI